MNRNKSSSSSPSGIVLLSKIPGLTSFSSLWKIKHALETQKVGHTGTLDSFAEGLLVVLTGSMTHLVSHVTAFTKTYRAVVCFGKQTDSLDPCGTFINKGRPVQKQELENVLAEFKGALLQTPPEFSALHVNGKRASDLMRSGEKVTLEPRQIFVYDIKLLDFKSAEELAGNGGVSKVQPASERTEPGAGETCERGHFKDRGVNGADPAVADLKNENCSYAVIEVTCSKGTYIRSLARDIAVRLGTCAYLCALRRTKVGPFYLEDAAFFSELPEFTVEYGIKNAERFISAAGDAGAAGNGAGVCKAGRGCGKKDAASNAGAADAKIADASEKALGSNTNFSEIKSRFFTFTPQVSALCGIKSFFLRDAAKKDFFNGRPLSKKMFLENTSVKVNEEFLRKTEASVFTEDGIFSGMISQNEEGRFFYEFVIPYKKKECRVFTWDEIVSGAFPLELKKQGTAVTVGAFDGMHTGHAKLIDSIKNTNLPCGIVTFRNQFKQADGNLLAQVSTLRQKLDFCSEKELDFAVVIDFSDQFSTITGLEFLKTLVSSLGMKVLSEGADFKCGYKGSFTMNEIAAASKDLGFKAVDVPYAEYCGKKVSSSLVRQCIKNADFNIVEKLLGSEFSYDSSEESFVRTQNAESGMAWYKAERTVQILPEYGKYKVRVVLEDGAFQTECCVQETEVLLLLPAVSEKRKVKCIQFISHPNPMLRGD
ncbi:MAG: tRNA pseudouridine(55) synthase TruB [Treponema sp.]|nr:tRNA pseudouridine(55) synthase TruB [Treponema sp.]